MGKSLCLNWVKLLSLSFGAPIRRRQEPRW